MDNPDTQATLCTRYRTKANKKTKNYTENFNDKQHDSIIQNRGEQRGSRM